MQFTWDEAKRLSNLEVHGLDFVDAHLIFEGLTFTFEDKREAYYELRFITFGLLLGQVVSLAHTETENEIRCISLRSATRKERKFFFEKIAN